MKKITMKLSFIITLLWLSTCVFAVVHNEKPLLVIDADNYHQLPKHFRTTNDPLPKPNTVSVVGLNNLHAVGSSQFSQLELKRLLDILRKPIIIVDLRQESHGFVNGNAISWYGKHNWANLHKTDKEVAQIESMLLDNLKNMSTINIYRVTEINKEGEITQTTPLRFIPSSVLSEEEMARNYHVGYKRIYVVDDRLPTAQQVDDFVQWVRALPPDTWLYFHCQAGIGRTSIFMAMLDMMKNAKQVSFEDILHRQYLLGGKDFSNYFNNWKRLFPSARAKFLKQFYDYCATNNDNFKTSWSEWLKKHVPLTRAFAIYNKQPLLVIDADNRHPLPKHFRTTSDSFFNPNNVSIIGLNNLHALGSGQFSQQALQHILDIVRKPITIVDLRQESHGFINGNAISWYGKHDWANLHKTDKQIATIEATYLANLKNARSITVYDITKKNKQGEITAATPLLFTSTIVFSEEAIAQKYHVGYKRIYVTDHLLPTSQQVDDFIQWVQALPPDTWLYFHCRAGVGRTTTFMAMLDMMKNAKRVSFDDIIRRQYLLGGKDLLKLPSKISFKYTAAYKRIIFLKNFYRYCATNNDNFKTSWSEWLKKH